MSSPFATVPGAQRSAREVEQDLLDLCLAVARGTAPPEARDQREANVLAVAAAVTESRFPTEAQRLRACSARYFADRPGEELDFGEVVRSHWIVSLPRLRDMLSAKFTGGSA